MSNMPLQPCSSGNVLVFFCVFQALLERTGYTLDVTTGQRKYGGPPPEDVFKGTQPGIGTEVYKRVLSIFEALIFWPRNASFSNCKPCAVYFDLQILPHLSPSSGVCWKNPKGFVWRRAGAALWVCRWYLGPQVNDGPSLWSEQRLRLHHILQ